MKALVLAAGKGERMRPLTLHTPKPLLPVGGRPLIVWHLEKLARLGIVEVAINTAWLAPRLRGALGDGSAWGLRIAWADEGEEPLETGGALLNALPLLGESPFLLVNGDVWTDFDFGTLPREPDGLAHLVLVDRPAYAARGDFALDRDGRVREAATPPLTYAGLGVYRPEILQDWRRHVPADPGTRRTPPRFPLAPLLRAHMADGRIAGTHHRGRWTDVGTPERLAALDAALGGSG
ncbi:N-acetylmuramate alpha-1-phosphate uridylyltransferase MurU [Coralloluteibacterium thermophilus]|uniref:N-acetylmuramate alpha-1-phosphate uridylyltransferase MurU n=1 Tax=Coralloluteibacterium thermophilum TaxID=2707049 RepID=A0ABV9NLB0_9GAMM